MNLHPQLLKRAIARVRAERRSFAILAAACAAVVLLFAPVGVAAAQPPDGAQAAEAPAHAGGEASLVLPDLGQAEFLGVNGRTLLMGGLVVCVLGLLFGLVIYRQLKALPVHASMREISELIYETCKTYLLAAGQVPADPGSLHRRDHRPLLRRAAALRAVPGGRSSCCSA